MKKFLPLILLFILLAIPVSFLWLQNKQLKHEAELQANCKPTFPDGDGPYYRLNAPFREKLVPDQNSGTKLYVSGRVLKNDCKTPVGNIVLDIWQADESGNYSEDWYRGKVNVSEKGEYSFETVVPKGYGEGTGYRPPHIHFKVVSNDQVIITSEMFFPDVKGKFNDEYIVQFTEKQEDGKTVNYAKHDIILP